MLIALNVYILHYLHKFFVLKKIGRAKQLKKICKRVPINPEKITKQTRKVSIDVGQGIPHKDQNNLSRDMRFPTMWYVRPAKPQISLRIRAV